jgi:hypothetical protein
LLARSGEYVLDPLPQSTGSVLAVQMPSDEANPVIMGIASGALVIIRGTARQVQSAPEVAIDNFVVRNTSVSSGHQSILVSFRVTRIVRLHAPRTYSKNFQALFTLFPRDVRTGGGCAAPGCGPANIYTWQIRQNDVCLSAAAPLDCQP